MEQQAQSRSTPIISPCWPRHTERRGKSKKGWLRWNGEPDPRYLHTLWELYRDGERTGDGGFHEWLQALFLDAFNNRRAAVATNPALPEDVRASFQGMPFLNGGLFERNELDDLGFSVLDGFFVQLFDRFQGEEPGFLEHYNFTVDESTPLDVEVAVDPEMLGKVYESLVAEEERHAAGIFYTPREEIDYMCRLSLIEYLHERTDLPKDDLIPLMMEPRRLLEMPEDGIALFGHFSKTKQRQALRDVEKALHQVRVVDPAVGSGSFPGGDDEGAGRDTTDHCPKTGAQAVQRVRPQAAHHYGEPVWSGREGLGGAGL